MSTKGPPRVLGREMYSPCLLLGSWGRGEGDKAVESLR